MSCLSLIVKASVHWAILIHQTFIGQLLSDLLDDCVNQLLVICDSQFGHVLLRAPWLSILVPLRCLLSLHTFAVLFQACLLVLIYVLVEICWLKMVACCWTRIHCPQIDLVVTSSIIVFALKNVLGIPIDLQQVAPY